MKAIRSSFWEMLIFLRRDMMLFAACLAPILVGFLLRFVLPLFEDALTDLFHVSTVISPYYGLIDILYAMLSPAMFCFVSAMVTLEENDEKIAKYLFITPLTKPGYLIARFGIPSVFALLITVILLPVFKLSELPFSYIVLLAAGGTLQGIVIALLILTFSSNKLEGMAVTKLSTLIMFGAAIPFFIKDNVQYILSMLPSFWIGKAVFEHSLFYMLPTFPLLFVWIWALLKRFLRKNR